MNIYDFIDHQFSGQPLNIIDCLRELEAAVRDGESDFKIAAIAQSLCNLILIEKRRAETH